MDNDELVDLETSGDEANDDDGNPSTLAHLSMLNERFKQSRFNKLGFRPQKEIFCNKYLPYADCLDEESQKNLFEVKELLAHTIALREMTPAIGVAVGKLLWYIKLYGIKFSKEDHIKFVKLLLALIELPNLEPAKLNKLCITLSQLLRKSSWLSPDDLQIDWRPLYNLSNIILNKNSTKGEMYRFFPSLESNLQFIIQQCALYFTKESVQDVLDELCPRLFPLDTGKTCSAFDLLSIFLNPTYGHELWLDDFINLWNTYHNPSWNEDIMNLLAVTAFQNVGHIDWEPYIPMIFTRIMRSIDLPVCYKNTKSSRNQSLWTSSVAIWIASVLGPKSSAQSYLTKLLGAIESYLHPANSGKWLNTISEIVVQLPKYLFDRLIIERFKPHPWKKRTPPEHLLTEECLTKFVESMKPIAFQAMYSRMNTTDVGKIFKHLADLRPEMIIPEVIDRVYSTLDSVTEPHKMTAALQCLISVSHALVTGHNGYTAGKAHVIPILYASLPGIDPNDIKKLSVTLQFLSSFALFIPIIDCSKAHLYHELSEEEALICGQTAEFEGFVMEYMDKIFSLIESSSQDVTRMEQTDSESLRSRLETVIESLLQSSTYGIIGQCSDEIALAAARKLVDYIKTNLLEPRVAAHLIDSLIRVFSRVCGGEIRKSLVPYVVETINKYMNEHDDIDSLDKQSDEMLYYIILLMAVCRADPNEVILFVDDLIPIIDRISKFKCKTTNKYSNGILINILSNLSTLQTMDVRSAPECYAKPLSEVLPIRHWGQKMRADTPIKWYMPHEKAHEICKRLIHRYLPPLLDQFNRYVNDECDLTRDEIQRDASTVLALLKCANFLPNWTNEEPIEVMSSSLRSEMGLSVVLGFEKLQIHMPNGDNVRLSIIKTFTKLQEKILAVREDDTRSLKVIILLWERVFLRKQYMTPFDAVLKNYNLLKSFQEFKLTKRVRDLRVKLAARILMQQDLRDELSQPEFTPSHLSVMKHLLGLSISAYSVIRSMAQNRLFKMISFFPYSYRCLLDDVARHLSVDSNENHESFKGILYVLCGQRRSRLIVKNDWECVKRMWLALLRTNLSEKPSVVRLLDMAYDVIQSEFPTVNIDFEVSDRYVEMAVDMLPTGAKAITQKDIELGKQRLIKLNEHNRRLYFELLHEILETVRNNSLHWRYEQMASGMIYNLVHTSVKYPDEVIQYCVNNLISESIEQRKCAIKTMRYIFKQQKREHKKIPFNPFVAAGVPQKHGRAPPGIRPDNRWLQYDLKTLPRNQTEWDEPRFLHKSEGFFGWSPNFSIYAPSAEQPPLNRKRHELSSAEQIIYDFIDQRENVDKLITFWSLEEKKGKEKFNRARSFVVKGLCNMFGDQLIEPFLKHLQRLIEDRSSESSHRCAAELMAGIMRGMKHWTYDMTNQMYDRLKPLIRLALSNISVETDGNWGTCFATAAEHFDPQRQYWLHEVLMEDPLRQTTSFVDCSRIYCLQGPFNQHVWRMNSVSHRLLEYLRPYLNHSFQNVRERLGSIFINIFEADLDFVGGPEPECPRVKDIMKEVIEKIQILQTDMPPIAKLDSGVERMEDDQTEEYYQAVRLFKTICHWIIGVLNRNSNGNINEYFELLPFACRLERCEQDSELAETCTSLLAMISQALTLESAMETALRKIDEVSLMSSWSARLAVIDVLQVLVFNNMPVVLSSPEWVKQVQTIVLRLLEDAALEVRLKSAQVLGGLLHCSFLPSTDKLLELFKKKSRTKIIKNTTRRADNGGPSSTNDSKTLARNSGGVSVDPESIRTRHMGVLGLCAFISAYPYDIPDFVPDVFEYLGAHLNDPQPIPSTIRKTVGDFKRTHHDNWAVHQSKFTEDQLAVLSDLSIPPSYYA